MHPLDVVNGPRRGFLGANGYMLQSATFRQGRQPRLRCRQQGLRIAPFRVIDGVNLFTRRRQQGAHGGHIADQFGVGQDIGGGMTG